jgi:glycosyltransferase involved in cell wall biosynthesis
VNRVASPVKFAEYLHAGLPVVLTRGIGDASGWVREHGLGVVLERPWDAGNAGEVLRALDGLESDRCRRFARERLDFDVTVPLYEEVYRRAASGGGAK